MSVFDTVGNWFKGFGDSEEEKRRKRQQSQQASQSTQPTQQTIKVAQPQQSSIRVESAQPTGNISVSKPAQTQRISQPKQLFQSQPSSRPPTSLVDKVSGFSSAFNNKLGGGIGRSLLRGADFLLPGKNTFGLEATADEWDKRAQGSLNQEADQQAVKVGNVAGTVAKGAADIATIAIPQSKIDRLIEANKIYKTLQDGSRIVKIGSRLVKVVPGSAAGSAVDNMQQVGRGDEPNWARSTAVGIGADVATESLAPGIRQVKQLFKNTKAGSIVSDIIKETDPGAIKRVLGITDDATASALATATDPTAVEEALKQLAIDPAFKLSDDTIKRLQESGVTSVKQDINDPYGASYRDGVISARDQTLLDKNVYHEMGHSLWKTKLTTEERALFNGDGAASKSAVGRNGYTPDDVNAEDFSDYVNKALTGRFDQVPDAYKSVIAKYAKIALEDPATAATAVKTIAVSSKAELDNFIKANPGLTPEQVAKAKDITKQRAMKLMNDLETSRAASTQAIDAQIARNTTDSTALTQQVDEARALQTAQNTPAPVPGVKVSPEPVVNPEQAVNNAYDQGNLRSSNEYIAEQARRLNDAKENPINRFFRRLQEQVYDPLATFQRYDTKGAVGDESIVSLMRRVTNPTPAVEVRLKQPISLPNGHTDSVWNIIKKYGKEDSPKATEFANYRMYKDELWRITEGGQGLSLRVNPQEMAAVVARYEAEHPDAIADNAVLREFSLGNLKQRADAGIDSQAIYEASAKNPFYSPRTRALTRNQDLAMTHTGGFTTTAKSTAARTGADVAVAPLDLYRVDARNTEMGLLKNKLGGNFYDRAQAGDAGFTVDVDPNTAVAHREAHNTFKSARAELQSLRELRDSLRGDKKLTAAELKSVATKAKAAEDKAVTSMRDALNKAANNPNDVLHDVAARDPRFDIEADAIKTKYGKDRVITTEQGTVLTPQEKTAQMNQELADLDAKYPDPNITTHKELLELAQSLDSGQFTAAQMAQQATTLNKQIPDLEQRLDGLRGQVNQSRQMVGEAKDAASQAWADLQDTTQHTTDFSGNTWTFKVDGEIGRGTAPAEIAAEMSKLLEFSKPGSNSNLMLRGTQTVGSITKAFWTGAFAPVWQTLNVAKNFGLMLHNGHMLSALSPSQFKGFVEGLVPIRPETKQFINELRSRGASYENLTQSAAMRNMVADDIAARANIGTFLARNPVKTFKDLYHMTSAAYTHVANAQRNAIAYGAYQRAVRAGVPEDRALGMAVEEITNVFGDLQRVSELAQALEPLIPYSGATQAGVRALINKAKTSPAEFAVKQGAIIAAATALTMYSLQNNKDYYQDQIDRGFTTDLDNNFVIVLPGAKRDDQGNWSGIVKIPITPDFRPLNSATWKSAYSVANGQGVDPGMVAGQLFNEFTGNLVPSVYDSKIAEQAGTPVAGVFTGSPVTNTGKILAGINPNTGLPLSDSDMALQPRTDQAYDTTSNFAQSASDMTQGALTPIQVDKLLGQLGSTGKAMKSDDTTSPWAKFFDFGSALTGGKGMTDKQRETQQYFDNIEAVSKLIDPNDKKTLKEFQALHAKKTDAEKDNLMNSATKASQFMQYVGDGSFQTTPLFDAEKQLDDIQRQQGQPGNPLFDLPAQALQKVLMYRSLKAANSAGQNYSKGGESAFTALGLDEKWYQDFRDAESEYYKKLNLEGSGEQKSFSGKPVPQLTPEQRAAQTKYFSYPAGSAERRAFLAANKWLKDFWAADNEFTDQERKALGFDSIDGGNTYDGKTASSSGYRGGFSSNGGYGVNTLTKLTNYSDSVSGAPIRKVEADSMPNLSQFFRGLNPGSGGGRAKPKLGASSSGR